TAKAWKEAKAPVSATVGPASAPASAIPTVTAADCTTTTATNARRRTSDIQDAMVTTKRVAIQLSSGARNHTTRPMTSRATAAARSGSTGRGTTSPAWSAEPD